MRTYSSGSGRFHTPGASQYPISPPPMKSVTNSKRRPFHVNRNGHDDGFRFSSSTVIGDARTAAAFDEVESAAYACRMPDGHSTRTTSAPRRRPRPNRMSAGAAEGVDEELSRRWRRLPARRSIFAPRPERLLTRAVSRTRIDALRLPPSLRHTATCPAEAADAMTSISPSPSTSAASAARADRDADAPDAGPPNARAVTSLHSPADARRSRGPSADHVRRSSMPSLS